MELLLVRIDHFQDRSKYMSVLREWLAELQIVNGRVISMGVDVQLLFVAASEAQNSQLLKFYKTRDIDTNSRGENCVDRFIDVLGRKKVTKSSSCKGFLEMNVLSPMLLQKVLVHEWQVEQEWMDKALASTRTKSFLEWKEIAKTARKDRRKRERQEKQHEREIKKLKKEAVQKERQDADCAKSEEASENEEEDKPTTIMKVTLWPKKQQPQKKKKKKPKKQLAALS